MSSTKNKEKEPLLGEKSDTDDYKSLKDTDETAITVVEEEEPFDGPPALSFDDFSMVFSPLEIFLLSVGILGAVTLGMMPLAFYKLFGQMISSASLTNNEAVEDAVVNTSYNFFFIAALAGFSALLSNFALVQLGEMYACRLRVALFKAITRQEVAWFDRTTTGSLITRLSENIQSVKECLTDKLGLFFSSLAQFFGGLGFAFSESWQLSLVMLGLAPFMGVVIAFHGKMLVKLTKSLSDASATNIGVAEEVISSFRTVRAFSQEDHEVERFKESIEVVAKAADVKSVVQGISLGMMQAVIWIACAVAFFFGGKLIGSGHLNVGSLVTVFGMMLFACFGLSQSLTQVGEIAKMKATLNMLSEIIRRPPRVPYMGGLWPNEVVGEIEFKDVSFNYPTRKNTKVLDQINFSIPAGKCVAFVGESGSGKSTTFSLIERFYDVSDGAIIIDGMRVSEIDPRRLHQFIGIVSQEPILFGTTIAENIAYGKQNATMEEIVEAAKVANAHDFIMRQEKQYQTMVGERGITLSGGQKQRVAIARAVLKDPRILLLDEATSALDTESEFLVQEALNKLMVNRTSLVIAHRLSTVRNCDTIFVMEKGKIIDQGTHNQLLEHSPTYKKLATRQLHYNDVDAVAS